MRIKKEDDCSRIEEILAQPVAFKVNEEFLKALRNYRAKDPNVHWWKRRSKNNKISKKFL